MLSSLVAAFLSGEATGAVRRARRAAVVYLFAGLMALVGAGFLVGAVYAAAQAPVTLNVVELPQRAAAVVVPGVGANAALAATAAALV